MNWFRYREWLRLRHEAALKVQVFWKGARVKKWFTKLKSDIVIIQAHARGYLIRNKVKAYKQSKRQEMDAMSLPIERRQFVSDIPVTEYSDLSIPR